MAKGFKTHILLVLAYAPALLFPLVDRFSSTNPYITWIYIVLWVIYVFILLVISYLTEKGE